MSRTILDAGRAFGLGTGRLARTSDTCMGTSAVRVGVAPMCLNTVPLHCETMFPPGWDERLGFSFWFVLLDKLIFYGTGCNTYQGEYPPLSWNRERC